MKDLDLYLSKDKTFKLLSLVEQELSDRGYDDDDEHAILSDDTELLVSIKYDLEDHLSDYVVDDIIG